MSAFVLPTLSRPPTAAKFMATLPPRRAVCDYNAHIFRTDRPCTADGEDLSEAAPEKPVDLMALLIEMFGTEQEREEALLRGGNVDTKELEDELELEMQRCNSKTACTQTDAPDSYPYNDGKDEEGSSSVALTPSLPSVDKRKSSSSSYARRRDQQPYEPVTQGESSLDLRTLQMVDLLTTDSPTEVQKKLIQSDLISASDADDTGSRRQSLDIDKVRFGSQNVTAANPQPLVPSARKNDTMAYAELEKELQEIRQNQQQHQKSQSTTYARGRQNQQEPVHLPRIVLPRRTAALASATTYVDEPPRSAPTTMVLKQKKPETARSVANPRTVASREENNSMSYYMGVVKKQRELDECPREYVNESSLWAGAQNYNTSYYKNERQSNAIENKSPTESVIDLDDFESLKDYDGDKASPLNYVDEGKVWGDKVRRESLSDLLSISAASLSTEAELENLLGPNPSRNVQVSVYE